MREEPSHGRRAALGGQPHDLAPAALRPDEAGSALVEDEGLLRIEGLPAARALGG